MLCFVPPMHTQFYYEDSDRYVTFYYVCLSCQRNASCNVEQSVVSPLFLFFFFFHPHVHFVQSARARRWFIATDVTIHTHCVCAKECGSLCVLPQHEICLWLFGAPQSRWHPLFCCCLFKLGANMWKYFAASWPLLRRHSIFIQSACVISVPYCFSLFFFLSLHFVIYQACAKRTIEMCANAFRLIC